MFFEYRSWFENIEIPGLPVAQRVQDPNPSEMEVSLDTTTLCLFPFHPESMGTFPTFLLVNALRAKTLSHLQRFLE